MVLVIDAGTSSVRGLIFDHDAVVKKKVQKKNPLYVSEEKTILQDAVLVLKSVLEILKQMGTWARENGESIECIAVTAQRSSVIPVDKNGMAIARAMSWQDKRAEQICRGFWSQRERIYRITGMGISPVFSAPKILYMKRENRECYDNAEKLIGFQEYILYHLTQEYATDTSIASRTGLFNISSCEWSEDLLRLYEVDRDKLCKVIPVGSIAGYTTETVTGVLGNLRSIPVISAGGDQQCAALGLGCVNPGQVEVNSGTGGYVIGISNQPVFHPDMSVNCNVSAIPGKWIVEGSVLNAGKAVDWIKNELFSEIGGYERFIEVCKSTSPGANGVIVSPSFSGKATPTWNTGVRAGIFNLNISNTKNELARAVLEGVAAEILECVIAIEALTGVVGNEIRAAGGLMKNPVYGEILCDMLGKTIYQQEMCEATAVGAWISAEITLGNYKHYEDAFQKYQSTVKTKIRTPDMKINDIYQGVNKLRRKYEEIYTDTKWNVTKQD